MIATLDRSLIPSSQSFEFKRVDDRSSLFPVVENIFKRDLTRAFGNQDEALRKIAKESNRRCEVALSGNSPAGLLVWKKENERDALIVPNLHIINDDVHSIPEIGEALVNRAIKCAQRNFAKKIHVTIPGENSALLSVLTSKNFRLIETTSVRSTELVKHHLCFTLPEKTADIAADISVPNSRKAPPSGGSDIMIRKRPRAEIVVAEKTEAETSLDSRRDEPNDGPARKRTATASERDERPRDYIRDRYESDRKRERYDVRDEPRRGIPITGPFTKGAYATENRASEPFRRQSDDRRDRDGIGQVSQSRIEGRFNPGSRHHSVTLMKKYIEQIRSGGKTIEGRINSGMFLKFKEGDTVRFFYLHNPADDVTCRIVKVAKFSSFAEMLEKEGFRKCLTDVYTLEDAVQAYDKIPGYREKAAQHGVLAIHLQVQR